MRIGGILTCDRSRRSSVRNSLLRIIIPGLVIRGPPVIPGEPGPIILVIDPNENLTGAIFEGLDYEAIYILDSSIFGHGDFGRLTATVNGTWLSRAELQILPDTKRFGIAGEFIPPGFSLTSSLPWNRANFSLFYDGPADTWLAGLDVGAVVHYTGQYEDDNVSLTTGSSKVNMPRHRRPRSDALLSLARAESGRVDYARLNRIATRSTCRHPLLRRCLVSPRMVVRT